jgi:hypothetical protein
MPGDPKQCQEHAKRCWEPASGATNPVLKESLIDLAQRWTRLASDLEVTARMLDVWGEPSPSGPKLDALPASTRRARAALLRDLKPHLSLPRIEASTSAGALFHFCQRHVGRIEVPREREQKLWEIGCYPESGPGSLRAPRHPARLEVRI